MTAAKDWFQRLRKGFKNVEAVLLADAGVGDPAVRGAAARHP